MALIKYRLLSQFRSFKNVRQKTIFLFNKKRLSELNLIAFRLLFSFFYKSVVGQTYSVFGIFVFKISVIPPSTSLKSSKPLDLRIDAAIILL